MLADARVHQNQLRPSNGHDGSRFVSEVNTTTRSATSRQHFVALGLAWNIIARCRVGHKTHGMRLIRRNTTTGTGVARMPPDALQKGHAGVVRRLRGDCVTAQYDVVLDDLGLPDWTKLTQRAGPQRRGVRCRHCGSRHGPGTCGDDRLCPARKVLAPIVPRSGN